ncbi:UDP-glucose/GDP-mannose dehydrogenase family protein [Candidatus Parcubacteria bacterium]|nr:MAG: UDP-glucose/GDP-mannose dehydrogenase family protein [Candidatus Parcubacteria bacterium]
MSRIPVAVIGVGMVGTPLARYFQEMRGYERGKDLFLYDTDPAKAMSDDPDKAAVVFICVPTPRMPDGRANLAAVESAFRLVHSPKIMVIKSTVPPGTTEAFQEKFPEHKVLFNPENLTEKFAWEDFVRPDAQIVGFTSQSQDAAHAVLSLLPKAPFMSPWGINTYRRTAITATEAEIIKYARNVHFYRKVMFANALAKLAERMGADYENVRIGMAADHRIGDSHIDVLYGGYRGVGGFCFPKDMDAFITHAADIGLSAVADLLRADRAFNDALLAEQGLALEDVIGHDKEHLERVKKKLEMRNAK